MSEEEKQKTKEIINYMLIGYEIAVEHFQKYGKFFGKRDKENNIQKEK